jgi:hypothetical protein
MKENHQIVQRQALDSIEFTAEQVARKEHEQLNPERYDFAWNKDFTTCKAIPLTWWDDKSYAAYQSAE